MKDATRRRSELLSIKVTPAEKARVLRAAKKMNLRGYSEFVRLVALGACSNLGIEDDRIGVSSGSDVPRSTQETDQAGASHQEV